MIFWRRLIFLYEPWNRDSLFCTRDEQVLISGTEQSAKRSVGQSPSWCRREDEDASPYTNTTHPNNHRTAKLVRDRSLSKSLSPTRSPKMAGIKNVIGEPAIDSLPHLSLDMPRNVSRPVARRRVRLTSDDIQLEKLALAGNNEYLIPQPNRTRGLSSPARVSDNQFAQKVGTSNVSRKEQSDGNSNNNNQNEFKSSQLIRQNSYTKLTLLGRKEGKAPLVLKQLSSESSCDNSEFEANRNGSTGGSTANSAAGYSAAVASMTIEIRVLQKLAKVPYVCHLKKNYIDRRGIRCMVMEYAEGGNMLEWLRMVRNFN